MCVHRHEFSIMNVMMTVMKIMDNLFTDVRLHEYNYYLDD